MTTTDWIIVAFTVLLAGWGYLRGFIVGALSLVGFAVGALIGGRVGPLLLHGGDHSKYAPLFGLLGALLAGGILATGLEGVGSIARSAVRIPGIRVIDGLLGAALTAAVALGIAWIVGAIVLQSTGSNALRRDVQRSVILRRLNDLLPPSGPILNALDRVDPLPSVRGRSADVKAPSRGIVRAGRVRTAGRSVVRVVGTACGLGLEGTGYEAGSGLVVTNAHVVAGETDTSVQVGGDQPNRPATVVVFDPYNDIAVLRVGGLDEPTLRLASRPASGTSAAILGYPENGPYDVQAGRIGATERVSTENAYGQGPIERDIVPLRGLVRPGNSGGPMVDARGQVVATVFAAITSESGPSEGPGGFAIPNTIVSRELRRARARSGGVSTQGCAG